MKLLIIPALLLLVGCSNPPKEVVLPTEELKITVDARLMVPCDTEVQELKTKTPEELMVSGLGAVAKLNRCACKHAELRNVLCKVSTNNCQPVKTCELPPTADTVGQKAD